MPTDATPPGGGDRDADLLHHLAAGTAGATGNEFFRSLVQHLASALQVRYAFITECTDRSLTRVRTLAFWTDQGFTDNIEYALSGTPCERVIGGEICHHPERLRELFPADLPLVTLQAESFLGLPIVDAWENVLGHVAALDDRPMPDQPRGRAVLQIFAARAAAELERLRTERALRESYEQLTKKNRYESITGNVSQAVHRSIDPQAVMQNAVREVSRRVERADAVGIHLVEGDTAVLRAQAGYAEPYAAAVAALPRGQGFEWRVIGEGRRRYCPDAELDRLVGPEARAMGVQSYLCGPIHDEGHAVGAITVLSRQKNAFDEDELKLMERLADQIQTAVNNARQAEALRRSQDALRAALEELEASRQRLQVENVYLQEEIRAERAFGEILGDSLPLQKMLQSVATVAPTESTALITGETGSGKELVARAIHDLSPRRESVLVRVNCGAIPATLIESELFGHERGAFTGAVARRIGRFELADGGTLFLDEIGDLDLPMQVKLLRVLQEGELERVGGTKTIRVNVRVIAATHRDLEEACRRGAFRQDLYYRLNVFPIRVPPLRERREDIPALVRHFVRLYGARMSRRIETVPQSVMDALCAYDWPGNVRELANILERSVIVSRGPVLELGELPTALPLPQRA